LENVATKFDKDSLPWIKAGLLFVGSGCAALIYEIIWFHLLRLVIGGSSVSMAIVLGTFMGGMCIGSLLLPMIVSPKYHPFKVYACLELGIGLIGATLPHWMPWLGNLYLSNADSSGRDLLARSLVASGCLLPATILMGATLPAIARWVKSTPVGLSRMGLFYGMNTLGAVLGCFIAGFFLLPQSDVIYASYVAAAVNLIVGLMALSLANSLPYTPDVVEESSQSGTRPMNAPAIICLVVGLSGFAALSAEVIWTRLLALMFGASTYTFAIILMVFLAGIGIGSTVAAKMARKSNHPLRWLALCQLALLPVLVIANAVISRIVPHWPAEVSGEYYVYFIFLHDTIRTMASVFPAALLWGATFSFAIAAVGQGQPDTGRLVGQLYASNTCGAILGSMLTSMWLVPTIGSQRTQQLMVIVSAAAALLTLYFERSQEPQAERGTKWYDMPWLTGPRTRWGALALAVLCLIFLRPLPHGILGNAIMPWAWKDFDHLFEKESENTSVVVMKEKETGIRSLCVAGKVEASTMVADLRCQRMLGHIGALVHPQPKSTLTVGLGAGTTAGSFVLYPEIEKIQICEIEPAIVDAARFFDEQNHNVVTDSRTEIVIDDARHFMATCKDKFDIISSDSIHPWVRGSAILYSKEYYELCKSHLNPGGVFVQWIPLYQTDMMTVSCELATFLEVFPHATLWSSGANRNHGYDIIAVAQVDESPLDLEKLRQRINSNPDLKKALTEVNLGTVLELFHHYVGRGKDLGEVLADAEINQESSLRLEYMAGMASHFQAPDAILKLIIAPLRYPADWLKNDGRYFERLHEVLGLPLPKSDEPENN
jgi:spermidine synthase